MTPVVVPLFVSGLPRLQRMLGPTGGEPDAGIASSVNGAGAVTSMAVMYLPPLPRPTKSTFLQTPWTAPRLTPPAVLATGVVLGSAAAPGLGTNTSEKRMPRAIM